MTTTLLLFGVFILMLIISVPIGVSLGIASVVTILVLNPVSVDSFTQTTIQGLNSFPLMAVPLFAFAGDIMGKGGISKRLLDLASILFNRVTGGLGVVAIVASLFFAAISGTGSGTVAAIGTIMIPAMVARNYNKAFSGALVATAGTLGAVIPPSITMIIYAVTAGVSVTGMFSASIGPGVLIAIALIIYTLYYARKEGYQGEGEQFSFKEFIIKFIKAIPALLLPFIVLGGIYGGVFTPTEAAAVAVVYGILVSVFLYKEVKISELPYIGFNAVMLSAAVLIIIGVSSGFGHILTIAQVPNTISDWILGISSNVILVMLLINLLLLFVGTFMETNAAIIILVPILLPVVMELGVDPLHFGIIMIINLAIGFITPPVGANLFMASQVSQIKFDELVRAIIPWILVMIVVLLVITFIPSISLWLPSFINN
ncbi:hypothetical protein J18TS1_33640 [Oceanobacillus oncorhynchi subsp. incaldanensis]|uniref:TRAP transporter large permease n=1 Tax=Oceanobacillus oncorhynchi TaxID=545501 RepID=UPI001B0F4B12|nr:TRAP transporter large permease [Oceanobacillus oncorhynchi]GIO20264.1 hypothetical protein J18TS1_33640 [Oceanobacillus oncorhynchi subsp. incaldanensis]